MQRDTETLLAYETLKAPATLPGAIVLRVKYHRPQGGVDQYMVHNMFKLNHQEIFHYGDYYPVLKGEDPRSQYYEAVQAWLRRVERYRLNNQLSEQRDNVFKCWGCGYHGERTEEGECPVCGVSPLSMPARA